MKILFDAQILQTPALKRGMGQYVVSIIDELLSRENVDLKILLSSSFKNEYSSFVKNKYGEDMIVELPLLVLRSFKSTQRAMVKNKEILNEWVRASGNKYEHFIIGSIFQNELYPAYPDELTKSAIMYDVIPLQLHEFYSSKMDWSDYLDRFTVAYESDTLFCISKTTANDCQVYANIPSEKIAVINGGPGEHENPKSPSKDLDGEFILMPTGNDIRKNNRLAIESFEKMNHKFDGSYRLVITSFFAEDEVKRLSLLSQNLIFTGVLSSQELAWYFSNCSAVFFPSLYEGLGMPLIEAAKFKKPLVASRIAVFTEISESVAYYFDPHNEVEASDALEKAVKHGVSPAQKKEALRVVGEYTWLDTTDKIITRLNNIETKVDTINKKRIAVLGPHVTGSSAIGKFIAELHPRLSEEYEIDYFYEKSPIDKVLRPDILGHVANVNPVNKLTDSAIKRYHALVYHIGNSNHHTITAARALRFPGVVILHDLHIKNVYDELYKRKLIDKVRLAAEEKLDVITKSESSYLQSLVANQKSIIVHSKYAVEIVSKITDSKIHNANLAVSTPLFDVSRTNKVFTIGLAGILAGIKGLEVIENLAKDPAFKHDRIKLFGLNFAEPGLLERIRLLRNVEVTTDLSDFEFQQKLKNLDLLVNYRVKYQGEASYATLEAMRYGVPVIVRGDFGWYAELPDDSVIKVTDEKDISSIAKELKSNANMQLKLSKNAKATTNDSFSIESYVRTLIEAIEGNDND